MDKVSDYKRVCFYCHQEIKNMKSRPTFEWQNREFCSLLCLGTHIDEFFESCSHCKAALPTVNKIKFCVRFGSHIEQFCSSSCLDNFKSENSFCKLCQERIFTFMLISEEKKFCSPFCVSRYNGKGINQTLFKNKNICHICRVFSIHHFEMLKGMQSIFFCSKLCISEYNEEGHRIKYSCQLCGCLLLTPEIFYYEEGKIKSFCSSQCANIFIIMNSKFLNCSICNVLKVSINFIKRFERRNKEYFCTLECLYKRPIKVADNSTELLGSASTVTQEQRRASRDSTDSLTIIAEQEREEEITSEKSTTATLQAPFSAEKMNLITRLKARLSQPEVKDQSTEIEGGVRSVASQMSVSTNDGGTQTNILPGVDVEFVPFPVYIPTPVGCFSLGEAVPMVIPVPIPIPIFIPMLDDGSPKTKNLKVINERETAESEKDLKGSEEDKPGASFNDESKPCDEGTLSAKDDEGTLSAKDDEGTLSAKDDEGTLSAKDDEGTLSAKDDEGTPSAKDDVLSRILPSTPDVGGSLCGIEKPSGVCGTLVELSTGSKESVVDLEKPITSDDAFDRLMSSDNELSGKDERPTTSCDTFEGPSHDKGPCIVNRKPTSLSDSSDKLLPSNDEEAHTNREKPITSDPSTEVNKPPTPPPPVPEGTLFQVQDLSDSDLPKDLADHLVEDLPDHLVEDLQEDLPDDLPDDLPEYLTETLPENLPKDLPEELPELPDGDTEPMDTSSLGPLSVIIRKENLTFITSSLSKYLGEKLWLEFERLRSEDKTSPLKSSMDVALKKFSSMSNHNRNLYLLALMKELRKDGCLAFSEVVYALLCVQKQLHLVIDDESIFLNICFQRFSKEFFVLLREVLNKFSSLSAFIESSEKLPVFKIKEEMLWESNQLGSMSPTVLLYSVFYFNTKCFFLHKIDDHEDVKFKRFIKLSSSSCLADRTPYRRRCLRYIYPRDSVLRKKVGNAYKDILVDAPNTVRCPLKLHEFYASKCSTEALLSGNFYMTPILGSCLESKIWYSMRNVSTAMLQNMLNFTFLVEEIQDILKGNVL